MRASAHRPDDIAGLLAGAAFPWWIAGGCALDLFLGSRIRARTDVDVAVLRPDQAELRALLPEWEWSVVTPDHQLRRWERDVELQPPLHEFLLNEATDTDWLYRRDRRVTYPLASLLEQRKASLPTLPPEIVLLYKSRHRRPEDEIDLRATGPRLSGTEREWLRDAVLLADPGHPWIPDLR